MAAAICCYETHTVKGSTGKHTYSEFQCPYSISTQNNAYKASLILGVHSDSRSMSYCKIGLQLLGRWGYVLLPAWSSPAC